MQTIVPGLLAVQSSDQTARIFVNEFDQEIDVAVHGVKRAVGARPVLHGTPIKHGANAVSAKAAAADSGVTVPCVARSTFARRMREAASRPEKVDLLSMERINSLIE